jgi:hypothetical protein
MASCELFVSKHTDATTTCAHVCRFAFADDPMHRGIRIWNQPPVVDLHLLPW